MRRGAGFSLRRAMRYTEAESFSDERRDLMRR
jgi:hypothetical protein